MRTIPSYLLVFFLVSLITFIVSFTVYYFLRRYLIKEIYHLKRKFQLRKAANRKILITLSFGVMILGGGIGSVLFVSPLSGLLLAFLVLPFILRAVFNHIQNRYIQSLEQGSLSFLYALQGFISVGYSLPSALFKLSESLGIEFSDALKRQLKGYDEGKTIGFLLTRFREKLPLGRQVGLYFSVLEMAYAKGLTVSPFLSQMIPLIEKEFEIKNRDKSFKKTIMVQAGLCFSLPWLVLFFLWTVQPELVAPFFMSLNGVALIIFIFIYESIGVFALWKIGSYY